MHRRAELLRGRRVGVVAADIGVVRLVAVRAPVPLELAGVGVDDGDALVTVAVRDVRLVRHLVDKDFRRPAEVLDVVAALALARLADLHQKLSGLCEFEDHRVGRVTNCSAGLLFILDLASRGRRSAAGASSASTRRCADAVAADPDIAFVIDRDAVIRIRPIVSFTLSAPTRDQIAFLIET